MPYDDDLTTPRPGPAKNWGEAARLLKKGNAALTDDDLFGDANSPSVAKSKPLDYLGHFANDDVMGAGHNVGAKQIGTKEAGSGTIAHCGYRSIPGNVNDPYIAKKVRQAMETERASMNRYGGPIPSHGYGPVLAKPDAMPLRKLAREAKMSAKRPQGPLTSTAKKR